MSSTKAGGNGGGGDPPTGTAGMIGTGRPRGTDRCAGRGVGAGGVRRYRAFPVGCAASQ